METCDHDDLAAQAKGVEELTPLELRERFVRVLDGALALFAEAGENFRNGRIAASEDPARRGIELMRNARRELRP